jgi:hypothetical protein
MDIGITQSARQAPLNPLPVSWLGRVSAPATRPDWAVIGQLSAVRHQNLLAQIAYDSSRWDYSLVGPNNSLGRYQISVQTLEQYGLLSFGAYNNYGIDAVNFQHCWRPAQNTYADYLTEVTNLQDFLNNTIAQENLTYQILLDLYTSCFKNGSIRINDSADTVAGMLYVAWALGAGTPPVSASPSGTGAYAWRYHGIGSGAQYYTAGRYAVVVLSK